jgi:hypothetical protein
MGKPISRTSFLPSFPPPAKFSVSCFPSPWSSLVAIGNRIYSVVKGISEKAGRNCYTRCGWPISVQLTSLSCNDKRPANILISSFVCYCVKYSILVRVAYETCWSDTISWRPFLGWIMKLTRNRRLTWPQLMLVISFHRSLPWPIL